MNDLIVFQPEKYSPSARTMRASGTLKDWEDNVLVMAKGQPWVLFSICFSFVGSLLKYAHMDSWGVHIYKETSQGKTTLAQVAASSSGCGSDPSVDKNSYLCRWSATANALVGVCAAHNDSLLVLDEFGTCPQKDAERFIYDIFGGKEKARMNREVNLREQRAWRVAIFSTGEISAAAKIAQSGTARGGHFVRLLDIPGGELISGEDPAKTAKKIKMQCSKYYGTVVPAFQQAFKDKCNGKITEAENLVAIMLSKIEPRYQKMLPPGAPSPYGRVMDRFALIEAAGQLACELLKWKHVTRDEIADAVETVCKAWLAGNDMLTDSARGVDAVRSFILEHKDSRFLKGKDGLEYEETDVRPTVNRVAGFITEILTDRHPQINEKCYAFWPAAFKEACGDIDPRIVARQLDEKNFLRTNDGGQYKHSLTGGRRKLYTVKESLLFDGDDEKGDSEKG